MQSLAALVALGAVVVMMPVSASRPGASDPNQVGPYAVGHTSFVIQDTSRTAVFNAASGPVTIPRPIPIHVFYPVDPSAITGATPQATYPLDMIYKPTDPRFMTTSSEWEAQGIDRAYQEPAPSAHMPFPLVMFSPGWGGPAWSAVFVSTRLASHGFVVALLYHYGDRVWSYEPAADHLGVASLNRPLDASFALTHLLARTAVSGDLLTGVIDPEKVAASGWSLGGYAAMALAAGDDLVCDKVYGAVPTDPPPSTCVPTLPDPRIRAVASLDGSTQLLWFQEMARISVPTFGIGQEWDQLRAAYGPGWESWQARLHAASQGHPKYRVDLMDTRHVTFSNRCESLPILLSHGLIPASSYNAMRLAACGAPLPTPEAHRIVTQYLVAFLKTNLAQEPGYQHVLTPGFALTREPMAEFFVTEKRNGQELEEDWPDEFLYFAHQPGTAKIKGPKNPAVALPVPHFGLIDKQ
jgi:predicted dienelactone hydrolase